MSSTPVPPSAPEHPWVAGARPRTLPAAVVPVALGAAASVGEPHPVWWRASLALAVSLALQVGVNYANDYSDGVRGTDDVRVGPVRLVAGGLKPAGAVKRAAFATFGVAAVCGLVLAAATTWWLLAVGAVAILAAWGYTGGPRPYGYMGLGEVFVFVFFGLVATAGTTYVVAERLTATAWIAGSAAGALACALLVVNNLRDIPTDRKVGKRTLAVRLGDRSTRLFYVALLTAAMVLLVLTAMHGRPGAVFGLIGIGSALPAVRVISRGAVGKELIPVLGATGKVQMITGVLAAIGVALTA